MDLQPKTNRKSQLDPRRVSQVSLSPNASQPKPKILVVEDELVTLEMVVHSLAQAGYPCAKAMTVNEAWEKIENDRQIGLVVLDNLLPGPSGMDLLRKIRSDKRFEHLPVILQSALEGEDKMIVGNQEGANRYLTKPVKPKLLLSTIESCLKEKATLLGLKEEKEDLKNEAKLFEEFLMILNDHADVANPLGLVDRLGLVMRQTLMIEGDPQLRLVPEGSSLGVETSEEGVLICYPPYGAVLPKECSWEQQGKVFKMLALMGKHIEVQFHQAKAAKLAEQLKETLATAGRGTLDLIQEIDHAGDDMSRELLYQKMKVNLLKILVAAGYAELAPELIRLQSGAMSGEFKAQTQSGINDLLSSFGL